MSSFSRFLAKSATVVGTVFGASFAVISLNSSWDALWQGLAALSFGSAIAGGIGWFYAHRRLRGNYLEKREQIMIALAKVKRGRLTEVELMADTPYPLEECRAFLARMTASGVAEMHIGKGGTVVYWFPGLLSDEEKRHARSAEDWELPASPPESSRQRDSAPMDEQRSPKRE